MTAVVQERPRVRVRAARSTLALEALLLQVYILMISLAYGLAAAVFVGGKDRFSTAAFDESRALVGWLVQPLGFLEAFQVWGVFFLFLGTSLVMTIGRRMAKTILRIGSVTYLFLALTIGTSDVEPRLLVPVSIVVFVVIAAIHIVLSVHIDKRGWR